MSKEVLLGVEGLKKGFDSAGGRIEILTDVSFQVRAGESLSVRGESGAGKSTLLNLLTLLERPDAGQVYWKGEAVEGKSNGWLARARAGFFGLVFQSFYLIPELNALENVLIAKRLLGTVGREDRERARSLLAQVGLGERLEHDVMKLSGGECQRVAVARALMNRPRVLIADEPTGNLDEGTADGVMGMLLDMCEQEGAAMVLVTHNREYAKRTDRCAHLVKGVLSLEEEISNKKEYAGR